MKIRRRDGTLAEVDDAYILQDGEGLVVDVRFMDASRRDMICDARGQPAGTRPGFLIADGNEQAERAVADAYAAYDEALFNRWKTAGVRQGPDQSQTTRSAPQQTFDSPEAAVAAAYAEYDAVLFNRWRSR